MPATSGLSSEWAISSDDGRHGRNTTGESPSKYITTAAGVWFSGPEKARAAARAFSALLPTVFLERAESRLRGVLSLRGWRRVCKDPGSARTPAEHRYGFPGSSLSFGVRWFGLSMGPGGTGGDWLPSVAVTRNEGIRGSNPRVGFQVEKSLQ
jgi:hypothetical protein